MIPIVLGIVIFVSYRLSLRVRLFISRFLSILNALRVILGLSKSKDPAQVNESLEVAGYAYDPKQDIFYSILNPWQKEFGYCRLYDEAAAPLGMIIDCEPVYFEYDGMKWLIEFWKGQYDLTTGCEVGVYNTKGLDLNIPGIFNGTFYECANEKDFLSMYCILKKNGRTLFSRKGRHWWLTGFRLGEYSEPSELVMYISITLKDREMRNAFLKGLKKTGYSSRDTAVSGNSVSLVFGKPHSPQPYTRSPKTDEIIQKKNKLLCDQYRIATKGYKTLQEKFLAVKEKAPGLFDHITGLGRPKKGYDLYQFIKKARHV